MSGALGIFALVLAALALLWLPRPLTVRMPGAPGPEGEAGSSAAPDGILTALARRLRRRDDPAEAGEWVDWIRQLAALIRAGQSPTAAFAVSARTAAQAPVPSRAVARQERLCRAVSAAAALGRSPSETLLAEAAARDRKSVV